MSFHVFVSRAPIVATCPLRVLAGPLKKEIDFEHWQTTTLPLNINDTAPGWLVLCFITLYLSHYLMGIGHLGSQGLNTSRLGSYGLMLCKVCCSCFWNKRLYNIPLELRIPYTLTPRVFISNTKISIRSKMASGPKDYIRLLINRLHIPLDL